MNSKNLKDFQEKIQYLFKDKGLLETALTHSSFANEHHLEKHQNNERLEFLGDAVLELVSSDVLFRRYPEKLEGELSKTRASLVCEPALAYCARKMNLGEYLRLGKGEDMTGGRDRDSILSDALEAVIGSIFLDGDILPARKFIMDFVLNDIENTRLFYDCKTILQENVQSWSKDVLKYELVDVSGPEHNRTFVMQIQLGDRILGQGSGRTKQAAGQNAAYQSLLELKAQGLFRGGDEDLCI
ncbi:ribonuclease III [Frisingicoccus sp.]|jgi:ribonuclease III|uniref:ribonuclease III n=1 Tax=Frisingicoccus sp. TaxID=1918627 RepID=UPI0015B914EA|nr:ribonuclease III [Frisingicoccus sp.]MEE0751259.1 ribonuclease III [Frisingicoccus sp.]